MFNFGLQKDLLIKIRKASSREDYENRNCGRFRRIFPCDDRARHAKYCAMLSAAFGLFLSGRGSTMRKEIEVNYNNKLRVGSQALQTCSTVHDCVDLWKDMLAKYEAEQCQCVRKCVLTSPFDGASVNRKLILNFIYMLTES